MKKIIIGSFIIIPLLLLGSIFYWYELRPAKIRHDCSWRWSGNHWYGADNYDYNFCIHEKGLRQ